MGNTCCQTNVDPVLIDSIPQFYDYDLANWPEDDEFIQGWMKENETEELKGQDPMKHKVENKYFLGNWNNGSPEGRGIVYEPGLVLYDGLFKNGELQGKAKIQQFKKNCQYEGGVESGKASGHGILRNKDGRYFFEGEWEGSKPKAGTLKLEEDPNVQRIQFKDFTKNLVEIYYTDGRIYYGAIDVDSFLPNGFGKVTFPQESAKNYYEGNWKHGMMAGHGKYLWKDGSHYQGNYRDGKKEGFGRFYFASGNIYEGQWENGKQEGLGALFDKSGIELKQGTWIQGKLIEPMEKQQYARESQIRDSFIKAKQQQQKAEQNLAQIEQKSEDYVKIEEHRPQNMSHSQKHEVKDHEEEKNKSQHQSEVKQFQSERNRFENNREYPYEDKEKANIDEVKNSRNELSHSEKVLDENKQEIKKSDIEKESDKKID